MRTLTFTVVAVALLGTGCSSNPAQPKAAPPAIPGPEPELTMQRLIGAYEQKNGDAYAGMFTGNFTYEFSNTTDPTLVQQYSSGWFKGDEKASSSHLFNGYVPPGGETLPAASAIDINLANDVPSDDNTPGTDPVTHKVLATRVDGSITVPQSGGSPLTYLITNNFNVFYFVRGDSAVGLDSSQPADSLHWYVYRWVDLTGSPPAGNGPLTEPQTWGRLKATYR